MAERTVEELAEYLKTVDPRAETVMYLRFIAKVLVADCTVCVQGPHPPTGIVWEQDDDAESGYAATPCPRCGDLRVMLKAGGM